MDIVGVTRIHDGKEVDEFIVGCSEHNYWYKGRPPITHGCKECWTAFFFAEWARGGGKAEDIDTLSSAIHHAAELADKGEWDFVPDFNVKIDKELEN